MPDQSSHQLSECLGGQGWTCLLVTRIPIVAGGTVAAGTAGRSLPDLAGSDLSDVSSEQLVQTGEFPESSAWT